MWTNIKKTAFEWLKTLSSKSSFFSSKRLERFTFTTLVVLGYTTLIIYEVVEDKLTATEFTIASVPLLVAAGYNMNKTEQAKKKDNEGISGEA